MSRTVDRLRQVLPTGLTGLAGVVCMACCLIPALLAARVLSGAGWAIAVAAVTGLSVGAGHPASHSYHRRCRRRAVFLHCGTVIDVTSAGSLDWATCAGGRTRVRGQD